MLREVKLGVEKTIVKTKALVLQSVLEVNWQAESSSVLNTLYIRSDMKTQRETNNWIYN